MDSDEFEILVERRRLRGARTIEACRLVLVCGMMAAEAARAVVLHPAVLSRALSRLRVQACPRCGQALRPRPD
jgi:hypothetical protein